MAEHYSDPDKIHRYSYHGIDHSLVDKVLKHWWNRAINLIPRRMHPNAVSLLGNLGSWASFAILAFLIPVFGPEHSWLFLLAFLLNFFYSTMDALDGMQARRLKVSGPCGEFIDHWFDTFNVFFIPLGLMTAFPVIPPWLTYLALLSILFNDWYNYKEVVDTNTLYFAPFSAQEGLVITWILMIVFWLTGYDFWASSHSSFGFPPILLLASIATLGSWILVIPVILRNRKGSGKYAGGMVLSYLPLLWWILEAQRMGLSRLFLFLGLFCLGITGARYAGDLLRHRLFGLDHRAYYLDTGLAALILAGFIILARLNHLSPELALGLGIIVFLVNGLTAMGLQFFRSLRRIRKLLGLGIFGPVLNNQPGNIQPGNKQPADNPKTNPGKDN